MKIVPTRQEKRFIMGASTERASHITASTLLTDKITTTLVRVEVCNE